MRRRSTDARNRTRLPSDAARDGPLHLAEDYLRARAGQEMIRREVDAALADLDALVLPGMPIAAPVLGAEIDRHRRRARDPFAP